jgi:hypothetical protein
VAGAVIEARNTTVKVDKIRRFRPPYVWTKTIVFLLTLDRESTDRCFLYACYGNPVCSHKTKRFIVAINQNKSTNISFDQGVGHPSGVCARHKYRSPRGERRSPLSSYYLSPFFLLFVTFFDFHAIIAWSIAEPVNFEAE